MLTLANRRRYSAIAAALLVVGALEHCMMEPIPGLVGGPDMCWSALASDSATPLGCPNESGCICRGATVVGRVCAPDAHIGIAAMLAVSAGSECEQTLVTPQPALSGGFLTPPPLSGRQLRALYASLVI